MKRIISLVLMLAMCITLVSPTNVKEVRAAEAVQTVQAAKPIQVSNWAIPTLLMGDTYGIYPLTWYEKDLTAPIMQGKFRHLTYGVRGKLVDSESVKEARFAMLAIDDSITVKEALVAFYTLLTNYDYTVDLGLNLGLDPVTYMQQIGVYTGQNGEQGLKELCSMEQAMVFATRIIAVVYDAIGASSKGFLWEVKSGENTVYLLGSIHIASNDIYPFSNDMWEAYYNSSALVVEANLYDQADTAALTSLMYYTDGTTLKDHVSADTYKKAIEAAALLGIPEATAASIKPWGLYMTFETYAVAANSDNSKISAQLGIDMTFETNATIYQKPIYAIEGMKKQGMMVESFSAGLQDYLLSSYSDMLSGIYNGTDKESSADLDEDMDTLFEAWKTGDIEGFKALTASDEEDAFAGELTDEVKVYQEEYEKIFMTQRDDSMAAYIDNLLKTEGSNTYFAVLGALHYISDYSVLDRLKKMGYEVTQVK